MKDDSFVSFNIPRVTGVRRPGHQHPQVAFSLVLLVQAEEDEAGQVVLSLTGHKAVPVLLPARH